MVDTVFCATQDHMYYGTDITFITQTVRKKSIDVCEDLSYNTSAQNFKSMLQKQPELFLLNR